ncbi:uncharacterized protein LOC133824849 [Humulus lupulus]|uniref:uncharacterized protein LOC133824849 n=1 Tax=Humulus lupulus TaxID=3486 RepID=UPI002B407C01|nr:uncharacterized protein LOC133824849 [Humulus lupulus]
MPQPHTPPPRPSVAEEKSNELQAALLTLTNSQAQFMTETQSSSRNLEMEVGQLESRPQGNLPSNTEVNPKEQCHAISLRSDAKLEEPVEKSSLPSKMESEIKGKVEEKDIENLEKKQSQVSIDHHIKIPFPHRLHKNNLDKQFAKFLEKVEGYETVALTEECSAILQKKLPPKLKDLSSFTVPCSIEGSMVIKILCDIGTSVNLMPQSIFLPIFRKLKLGEARHTTMSLQMVDRSVKHPRATGRALIDVPKGELKLCVQQDEKTFNVFAATEIPTCYGVDVIIGGGSKVEVTKRKVIAQVGSRTMCHRLKRFVSGKAQLLHERWKVPPLCNIKKRASSYDIMALKDLRGGLDPS